MTTTQQPITDFFKSKRKRLITDYFKPKRLSENLSFYTPSRDYRESRRYLKMRKHIYDAHQTRKGYYYCATGDYSEYHVYSVINRPLLSKGKKIIIPEGACVARAIVDSNSSLEHISVEPLFQRQGIGKNLIRFINKHDTQFHVYAGIENNSRYRLTQEGAALIRSCEEAGILDEEQVILNFVPQSPGVNLL